MSFRILLTAWPMWMSPLAYGGPSCSTKRGRPCARGADALVDAVRPASRFTQPGSRLREVAAHRERRVGQVQRRLVVGHRDRRASGLASRQASLRARNTRARSRRRARSARVSVVEVGDSAPRRAACAGTRRARAGRRCRRRSRSMMHLEHRLAVARCTVGRTPRLATPRSGAPPSAVHAHREDARQRRPVVLAAACWRSGSRACGPSFVAVHDAAADRVGPPEQRARRARARRAASAVAHRRARYALAVDVDGRASPRRSKPCAAPARASDRESPARPRAEAEIVADQHPARAEAAHEHVAR